MRKIVVVLIIAILAFTFPVTDALGIGPVAEWNRTFGDQYVEGSNEEGRCVQQTLDGGYVIVGMTQTMVGGDDVWLLKTDDHGNLLWDRTFSGLSYDEGNSVQQTFPDEGYIITGLTYRGDDCVQEVWLLKTDFAGNMLWERTFGGPEPDEGHSVQQTFDGGYIIAGLTFSYGAGSADVWLLKTDADGNEVWARTFGGEEWDKAYCVQQTSDGGYIIVGETRSCGNGSYDVFLIKTNFEGVEEWSAVFGGPEIDFGCSVQQTFPDGGYILTGTTYRGVDYYYDVWLLKTDAGGNLMWDKTFGGEKGDDGRCVQQTSDGGYIIAGWTHSFADGPNDTWLIKTDFYGEEEWNEVFGGPGEDLGFSVRETFDGGYIIGGVRIDGEPSFADVNLIKVSFNEINQPPEADAGGPYVADEGSPVILDASESWDPEGDELKYRWDFNNDGDWDTDWLESPFITFTWEDNCMPTVRVEVSDIELSDIAATLVQINNVAPSLGEIIAPTEPVPVGSIIDVSADFTDPGTNDWHTALWDWGDDSTSEGDVDEAGGSVTGTHAYASPGVYTVKLTVTDKDDAPGKSVFQYVVVYDPVGGFVTGGGWINSLPGAYAAAPELAGKATFGFISRYKKGADTPTGETEFQFRVADLNFHSTSYQWLVVAGARAKFKGTGTINGAGNYGFMLTAIDGDIQGGGGRTDKFRIKIWDKDSADAVVYDNDLGVAEGADPTTVIGGGSIVIHKK